MTTITLDTADHELLRLTHAGRADAFTALYRRHQAPLYRYALMRCGAPEVAADVVQEAFMGLLMQRFGFDPLRGQLQHFLLCPALRWRRWACRSAWKTPPRWCAPKCLSPPTATRWPYGSVPPIRQ